MSKSVEIIRIINNSEEKKYLEVPFTVPENIDKLEVRYKYIRRINEEDENGNTINKEINVVDIAVLDETKTFRGWSGSERLYFTISENHATPGYIEGKVNSGIWNLVLGAYKIQDEGCEVIINITFTEKSKVLLKGDLHMHSEHSDGRYTVDENIEIAKRQGLDFIFLTDHNTYAQNGFIRRDEDMVILPGMEWTHYNGHCNFLGVNSPIKNFVANSKEETLKIMNEARENGAIISLNHTHCNVCPWLWGFDVPYDVVEVWNGPMSEANLRAINWWQEALVSGKRIPIVGGSDAHRSEFIRTIGTPTTYLYSNGRGKSSIIDAIKNGNSFITYNSDGPIINMAVGEFGIGDIVREKNDYLEIIVEKVNKGDSIKVITEKGMEKEFVIGTECKRKELIEIGDRRFFRVEIWRNIIGSEKILVALSNPIYFM